MIATEKIRRKWKYHRAHGDATKISAKYKISINTISNTLLTGRGAKETINAINEYYSIDLIKVRENAEKD